MLNQTPNSNCGILYVDDEEKALKYFRMAFSSKYPVFTATSGEDGLALLRQESSQIGIVVSDQRMPGMSGAEFLGRVREDYPSVVRILTTAYSDLDSAIQAVNQGHIYQYVVKPWDVTELGMVLQRASDYFHILMERNELLALKMATLQRILCSARIKGLLLASRSWNPEAQTAFRRTLGALVRALPDSLNTVPAAKTQFQARDFDITTIICNEFQNASQSLDAIDRLPEAEKPLEAALQKFAAALNESGLPGSGQASARLVEEAPPRAVVSLQANAGEDSAEALHRSLFSLLVGEGTSALSLSLLELLFALSDRNGILEISGGEAGGQSLTFSASPDVPVEPNEIIQSLYEKFSAWDIAKI